MTHFLSTLKGRGRDAQRLYAQSIEYRDNPKVTWPEAINKFFRPLCFGSLFQNKSLQFENPVFRRQTKSTKIVDNFGFLLFHSVVNC